jgi:hypothetical protein
MNRSISLSWVKGHSGIVGNEVADTLAKSGVTSNLPASYSRVPLQELYKPIQDKYARIWRNTYLTSSTGEALRQILPSLQDIQKRKYIVCNDYRITGALTGHIGIQAYLHRFHLADSNLCPLCEEESEDVTHIIFRCPALMSYQRTLLLKVSQVIGRNATCIKDFTLNKKAWKILVDYVKSCKRFDIGSHKDPLRISQLNSINTVADTL